MRGDQLHSEEQEEPPAQGDGAPPRSGDGTSVGQIVKGDESEGAFA